MSEATGRRILSLNLHGLGDFILTLPTLKALAGDGAESITSLVWPAMMDFAKCVKEINRPVVLPPEQENEPELTGFVRSLKREEGFEIVLDFSFLPRAAWICRATEGGRTFGFGIDQGQYPWYTDTVPNDPAEPRVRRNFHLLELLGIRQPMAPDFSIGIRESARKRVESLLSGLGIEPHSPMIALHPGSGLAVKRWLPENFAALADRLAGHSGAAILLLGAGRVTYDGTDEVALAARVEKAMHMKPVNLAGCLNIPELACVLERCVLFVGNDSGIAHLAASVAGVPVLLVWGPGNETVWRPNGPLVEVVRADLGCHPCPSRGCEDAKCLPAVSVDAVYERYLEVIARSWSFCVPGGRR